MIIPSHRVNGIFYRLKLNEAIVAEVVPKMFIFLFLNAVNGLKISVCFQHFWSKAANEIYSYVAPAGCRAYTIESISATTQKSRGLRS